jgi:hypothetical protein
MANSTVGLRSGAPHRLADLSGLRPALDRRHGALDAAPVRTTTRPVGGARGAAGRPPAHDAALVRSSPVIGAFGTNADIRDLVLRLAGENPAYVDPGIMWSLAADQLTSRSGVRQRFT